MLNLPPIFGPSPGLIPRRSHRKVCTGPGRPRSGSASTSSAAMPDRYRVLVLMAAWSGLCQGELLALTRADLDLTATSARVVVWKRCAAPIPARSGWMCRRLRRGCGWSPCPVRWLLRCGTTFTSSCPTSRGRRRSRPEPGPSRPGRTLEPLGAAPARRRECPTFGCTTCATSRRSTPPKPAPPCPSEWPASATPALVYLHARNDRDAKLAAALGEAMSSPARQR